MKTSSKYIKEQIKPTKKQTALELDQKVVDNLNWEKTAPLNPALDYIVVPQRNFAAEFKIGNNEVTSKRLWLVGVKDGKIEEIRSVGISTLTSMALGLVDPLKTPVPVEAVVNPETGKMRVVPGHQYIHAMEDYSFVKGENKRAVVKNPIILKADGSLQVYRAQFNDDKTMKVTTNAEGKHFVETAVDSMKRFSTAGTPSDELVASCTALLQEECGDDFYPLS